VAGPIYVNYLDVFQARLVNTLIGLSEIYNIIHLNHHEPVVFSRAYAACPHERPPVLCADKRGDRPATTSAGQNSGRLLRQPIEITPTENMFCPSGSPKFLSADRIRPSMKSSL
jgi:hypothetical protein